VNDREICASFVQRAEAAGYGAIVVTLDTLTLGWRPRDLRRAYLPFIKGEGCGQFFTDPVFLSRLDKPPDEDILTAAAMMLTPIVCSTLLETKTPATSLLRLPTPKSGSGFTILELSSLGEALEWAARCPAALYAVVDVHPGSSINPCYATTP